MEGLDRERLIQSASIEGQIQRNRNGRNKTYRQMYSQRIGTD